MFQIQLFNLENSILHQSFCARDQNLISFEGANLKVEVDRIQC